MDEGNNLTCLCGAEGGNPTPNVTWYKDDLQIGKTRYGKKLLNLTDLTKKDNGTYKCVVQSYTLKEEKFITVFVYRKYMVKYRYIPGRMLHYVQYALL